MLFNVRKFAICLHLNFWIDASIDIMTPVLEGDPDQGHSEKPGPLLANTGCNEELSYAKMAASPIPTPLKIQRSPMQDLIMFMTVRTMAAFQKMTSIQSRIK